MPAGERAGAKALGLDRYRTNRPCKHGHVAERRTVSGHCVVCHLRTQNEWDRRNKDQRNTLRRQRYNSDPEFAERSREHARASYLKAVAAPKESISLVAHEGTSDMDSARAWVKAQARRLGVTSKFIMDAIRNKWTLTEIEMLSREDVAQLADHVRKHRPENGFVRWEPFGSLLHTGYMD